MFQRLGAVVEDESIVQLWQTHTPRRLRWEGFVERGYAHADARVGARDWCACLCLARMAWEPRHLVHDVVLQHVLKGAAPTMQCHVPGAGVGDEPRVPKDIGTAIWAVKDLRECQSFIRSSLTFSMLRDQPTFIY